MVVQVYAPNSNAEEAEVERFCEDLQDLLELTNTPKRCPFHYRGLKCKSRKSRDTWSNRQIWPWSTKQSKVKANRVLPRERTGHSKHPLPTTKEKTLHMDITKWSTPKSDWLYSLQPKMEKLYIVRGEGNGNPLQCSCLENPRDGGAWWAAVYGVAQSQTQLKWLSSSSSIQSGKTRPGADCGSDHELLIAKFRLKLKKIGKTTRPFRYDLNLILYNWLYSGSDK